MNETNSLGEEESCAVGDWFALGSVFTPMRIDCEGKELIGMRQLVCIDVTSHYIIDFVPLKSNPEAVLSKYLLFFVAKVMTEKGVPKKGFIVLKSAVLSSDDLAQDNDTSTQGAFIRSCGLVFPAMADKERDIFRERMKIVNLSVSFQGLKRVEADVTSAFTEQQKISMATKSSTN